MGSLFERFGHLSYSNEAEVSQNFTVPLLTEFLGYSREELRPEEQVPAAQIPLNRENSASTKVLQVRPDYVVYLGTRVELIVDSKAPTESIDDHVRQLIAYSLAHQCNLLLITNGIETRLYDAATLLIAAPSCRELDINFNELKKLIGREEVAASPLLLRLQAADASALSGQRSDPMDDERRKNQLALSDYIPYLRSAAEELRDFPAGGWDGASPLASIRLVAPAAIHHFQSGDRRAGAEPPTQLDLSGLLKTLDNDSLVLVGDSGIGKTSLLRWLAFDQARRCLSYDSAKVPVVLPLGLYASAKGLRALIAECLALYGLVLPQQRIDSDLLSGRYALFYDAYDEIFDSVLSDADREIRAMRQLDRRMVLTTRALRVPRGLGRTYEFAELTPRAVESFVAEQLDESRGVEFLALLHTRALWREATNTLLLALMLSFFQRGRGIPAKRLYLLQNLVALVREREENKPTRCDHEISWELRYALLKRLAFAALNSQESYQLSKTRCEEVVREALVEWEASREIAGGFAIPALLKEAEATGFIRVLPEGIVFWNRAFMEYFAAEETARLLNANVLQPEECASKPTLRPVAAAAVAMTADVTTHARRLIAKDFYLAACATGLAQGLDNQLVAQVCVALQERCGAPILAVRQLAVAHLTGIDHEASTSALRVLLAEAPADVQAVALVELVRRGVDDANALVQARLQWDAEVPFYASMSPRMAVIEALGKLGDPESQQGILGLFSEGKDFGARLAAEQALGALAGSRRLTRSVQQALISILLADHGDPHDQRNIAGRILARTGDLEIAAQLVAAFEEPSLNLDGEWAIGTALTAFMDGDRNGSLTSRIAADAMAQGLPENVRRRLARILAGTSSTLPLETALAVATAPADCVRRHGVALLARYPFAAVRDILQKALECPSDEELGRRPQYGQVQLAAIGVLVTHGKVATLVGPGQLPRRLSTDALEAILRGISEEPPPDVVPFLRETVARVRQASLLHRDRAILSVALGCAFIASGLADEGEALLSEALRSDDLRTQAIHELLPRVNQLPRAVALRMVDLAWQQADGANSLARHQCFEAWERLGGAEARTRLAEIVPQVLDDLGDAERALRSYGVVADGDSETWVLGLLESGAIRDNWALNRAISILGAIGTTASLPTLRKSMRDLPDWIRETSFDAMKNILRRAGIAWYGEDLSSGEAQ